MNKSFSAFADFAAAPDDAPDDAKIFASGADAALRYQAEIRVHDELERLKQLDLTPQVKAMRREGLIKGAMDEICAEKLALQSASTAAPPSSKRNSQTVTDAEEPEADFTQSLAAVFEAVKIGETPIPPDARTKDAFNAIVAAMKNVVEADGKEITLAAAMAKDNVKEAVAAYTSAQKAAAAMPTPRIGSRQSSAATAALNVPAPAPKAEEKKE